MVIAKINREVKTMSNKFVLLLFPAIFFIARILATTKIDGMPNMNKININILICLFSLVPVVHKSLGHDWELCFELEILSFSLDFFLLRRTA